jgi:alpha-galactosidase
MIEFRQPYIGPLMRKYGNMFRSVDCPNNATQNRVQVTDVRLLAGNTAVHSDMFMWNEQEPVEAAARQLLSVLFSVPQLSVRLSGIPAEHRRMLAFWTQYWKDRRAVLLDGTFVPIGPGEAYPVLIGSARGTTIAGVYADAVVPIGTRTNELHLVNGKGSTRIVVDLAEGFGRVRVTVYDTEGYEVQSYKTRLGDGVHAFDVPPSGLVMITRI